MPQPIAGWAGFQAVLKRQATAPGFAAAFACQRCRRVRIAPEAV
jgi:hypothetical protein